MPFNRLFVTTASFITVWLEDRPTSNPDPEVTDMLADLTGKVLITTTIPATSTTYIYIAAACRAHQSALLLRISSVILSAS